MKGLFSELLPRNTNGLPNEPYSFQLRVAELLLNGRNVVLTAPTGAGKTWTALFPFLYARQMKQDFTDRVIYALPLRTLASSLYESTKDTFFRYKIRSTIQMGNQPDDPHFKGDVIFTTIDQLLSAYIGLPFGTSKASANIPAGAMIGAYVIIDEFHLLSYTEALPTFLDMMKRLYPYTRFLLMTATAPKPVVTTLEKHICGQAVTLSSIENNALPKRIRRINWSESQLSGNEIARRHQGGRTLVIVNEVKRAQELYFELVNILKSEEREIDIRVLHSRLFTNHREEVEGWVLDTFARNSSKEAILISTQVVEAGIDISSDVLLTDLCPANALLQRIGRCARFPNESGSIFVYSVREGEKVNFLPYASVTDSKENTDNYQVMVRTEEALKQFQRETELTSEIEEHLIETVHGSIDQKRISSVMRELFLRSNMVTKALVTGDADTNQLIRSIDNLSVIIHHTPDEIDLRKKAEMVSISRSTLYFFLKGLKATSEELESRRLAFVPKFPDNQDATENVTWHPIKSRKDVLSHTIVILSPEIADYDSVVGLRLGKEGTRLSQPTSETISKEFQRYSYQRETYLEHIQEIRKMHRKEKEKYIQATNTIAKSFMLSPEMVEEISELTTALHDVGKLGVNFQRKLRRWQTEYKQREEQELLAHTDFDGTNRAEREEYLSGNFKPPHHAVEGAAVLQEWVGKTFDRKVAVPILLTIMRHHYAFSERSEPVSLAKGAREHVLKSLAGLPYEPFLKPQGESHHFDILSRWLEDPHVLAFYWYLSRRLRISDQMSLEARNLSNRKEEPDAKLQ